MHWQQGNYQLWERCFMYWNPVLIAGLRVWKQLPHPQLCQVSKPLGYDPSVKNGLALAIWYHTPGTTTRRLWVRTILHGAAYTRHLCINNNLVCGKHKNIFPWPTSRVITSYELSILKRPVWYSFGHFHVSFRKCLTGMSYTLGKNVFNFLFENL